ncbi:MAG: type II toxin-antitoxin system HicB family antitoxin [Chloroflexi bacterium]|nr:type II toxin-antitoxin system HicB family antitoxin [Chloroflexota bacterium]
MKYVVVFEKAQNNWCAFVPDLPGCVATGETFEETKEMIREAIEFHIESYVEDDEEIPHHSCVDAAVVEVKIPEGARFAEPEYPLWDKEEVDEDYESPALSQTAEVAD